MINRRNFLKTTGAFAAGSLMMPSLSRASAIFPSATAPSIGIQVYSINKFLDDDVKASFQKLATIGFKNLETAFNPKGPYYGYTPRELASMIKDLSMTWISHHVMGAPFGRRINTPQIADTTSAKKPSNPMPAFLNLRENLQQLVDEASQGGIKYLVCASTPIKTMDEVKASIETFVKAGELCKKNGIQFVYHNHATEFDPVEGGKSAYELILSQTDKDQVKMELDLAWASKAKQDPAKIFKENPGRFPLWHIKDYDLVNNKITPIGLGSIDFKPIFALSELAGMKYFFYEQDNAQSMDDVSLSFNNLKKILS